jgi:hypothetical protein
MPHPAAKAPRLVPVQGRALDGTVVELPAQLPARCTVVVLAFRQRQQRDVDRWIDLAVALGVPASPLGVAGPMETAVIEVPVLGRRYLGARRFIDGGMAMSIADPAVLARTITVYTDPVGFRRRCGVPTAEEVTVLLADRDGAVTWHRTGPPQADDRAALADALATGQPGS